jgi:hypothetical protein
MMSSFFIDDPPLGLKSTIKMIPEKCYFTMRELLSPHHPNQRSETRCAESEEDRAMAIPLLARAR